MDNRLIFLYFGCFVTSWGGTKREESSLLTELVGANCKVVETGKSVLIKSSSDANF